MSCRASTGQPYARRHRSGPVLSSSAKSLQHSKNSRLNEDLDQESISKSQSRNLRLPSSRPTRAPFVKAVSLDYDRSYCSTRSTSSRHSSRTTIVRVENEKLDEKITDEPEPCNTSEDETDDALMISAESEVRMSMSKMRTVSECSEFSTTNWNTQMYSNWFISEWSCVTRVTKIMKLHFFEAHSSYSIMALITKASQFPFTILTFCPHYSFNKKSFELGNYPWCYCLFFCQIQEYESCIFIFIFQPIQKRLTFWK